MGQPNPNNVPRYVTALNNYRAYANIRPTHLTDHYRRLLQAVAIAYQLLTAEERERMGAPPPQVLYYINNNRVFNTRTENHQRLWEGI
jgi:hypothetical protein